MLFLETPREIPGKSPFNLSWNRTTEKMFNQNSKTGYQGNGSRGRRVPKKSQLNHVRADPEQKRVSHQSSELKI